jgi:hypothetical protein
MREIWDRLGIEWRQRFQKTVFPDGLAYTSEKGFGTVASSRFINILRSVDEGKSQMARPPGVNWNHFLDFIREVQNLAEFEGGVSWPRSFRSLDGRAGSVREESHVF